MNKRKIIYQVSFLILIMTGTIYYLLRGDGLNTFIDTVHTVKTGYVLLAVCMLMAFILLESLIIKILFNSLDQPVTMARCCKYSFVGFFFYCISPAGSGEQPAQLIAMRRDGIDFSKSILSLGIITITFKMALVLLGIFVYVFRLARVMEAVNPINWICLLGMGLSLMAIALFICAMCIPQTVYKYSAGILHILAKHNLIKDEDKKINRLQRFLARYTNTFSLCLKPPGAVLAVLLISIIQRSCLLSVTGFSCMACGMSFAEFPTLVLIQEMIQLSTEMLPLPGGMGASEALYLTACRPILGGKTLATLIVSRGISFYGMLILCGAMSLIIYVRHVYKKGGL